MIGSLLVAAAASGILAAGVTTAPAEARPGISPRDAEQVRAVLAAVAPIVGTARIASATGNIVRALAFELEDAGLEEE